MLKQHGMFKHIVDQLLSHDKGIPAFDRYLHRRDTVQGLLIRPVKQRQLPDLRVFRNVLFQKIT